MKMGMIDTAASARSTASSVLKGHYGPACRNYRLQIRDERIQTQNLRLRQHGHGLKVYSGQYQ